MFDVIKSVLSDKRYELTDILKKIDFYWISGKITDTQKEQLVNMAQGNASVNNSITSAEVLAKLAELEKTVATLQKAVATLQGGDSDNPEIETDETKYPDFESGKWYYTGDKVAFDGARYICIAPEGTVCVWSPAEYPAYWQAE